MRNIYDAEHMSHVMAGERACSGAGMLCKAFLSLKTMCAEYSRPAISGRERIHYTSLEEAE